MKTAGIFFNPYYKQKEELFKFLKEIREKLELEFYKTREQADILPDFICTVSDKVPPKLDLILVFGGDGTILKAVDFSLKTGAPILGINLGKLGFLAESSLLELEKSLENLKKKKFTIQPRMLLKVILKRDGKNIYSSKALNDAVIYKGQVPKLMDIRYYNNQRFVVETRCDGIIVASPTGSTAYSLSAGGPIISPVMDVIAVTPLNPHVLTMRPMIFPSKDILTFKVMQNYEEAILQLDGQNSHVLETGDEITITAANRKVDFIKLTNKTFYQILRKKLHLGKK